MFSADPVLSTSLGLGVTLLLIWLGARVLTIISRKPSLSGLGRRMPSDATALTIESVTPIAPRRRVIVLRYGEHRLAVLTGGPQDVSLGWLPPPPSSGLP